MPNTHRSQPQNWLQPFRNLPSATLAPDESLAMVLHYELKDVKKNQLVHVMFAVVRKGEKAIARSIMSHGNGTGYCAGHADDIAEYPIANTKELVQEVRNHGLMMATMVMQEPADFPIKMDISKPAYYLQTPSGATNTEVVARMHMENDPEGQIPKQVIISVLGLENTTPVEPAATVLSPVQNETMTDEKALEKAAIEKDLIKRFGKKPMEELAKKMNYQGQIINKTNSKAHVNNN